MTIAQRFNAGLKRRAGQVPEGRLDGGAFRSSRVWRVFRQPSLRDFIALAAIPALKRRAILTVSLRDHHLDSEAGGSGYLQLASFQIPLTLLQEPSLFQNDYETPT